MNVFNIFRVRHPLLGAGGLSLNHMIELLRTLPLSKLSNIMAFSHTLIPIRFTIATTNRLINLGAHTICISRFFNAIACRRNRLIMTSSHHQKNGYCKAINGRAKKSSNFFHNFYFFTEIHQTTLLASSVTSIEPSATIATPTGRPRTSLFEASTIKPVKKS